MAISLLLVDDSEAMCQYLLALLKSLGVEFVDYCLDAESALLKIERNPEAWDAVFVDLHMEGMDGLQMMHTLHEMHFRGGIIIMSALDRKILEYTNQIVSKYNLRIIGSIHKPFEETTVAFITKRIRNFKPEVNVGGENYLKRKQVQAALSQQRLVAYFQPVVNPNRGSIISLECLVRLDIEGRGTVLPRAFIPVAERFDLIGPMTMTMLSCVLPQFKFFKLKTGITCKLSVNLSPLQLDDTSLPDRLYDCVTQHELDPSEIIFEITENAPLRSPEQTKNLSRLRIRGFELALDDFGAGFTNLGQISSIPYTQVKLDRQLIQGIGHDRVLHVITKSVLEITNALGIDLVAEGVENSHDLNTLNEIGVINYQGFLFCRPKPLGELVRWCNAWQRVSNDGIGSAGGD